MFVYDLGTACLLVFSLFTSITTSRKTKYRSSNRRLIKESRDPFIADFKVISIISNQTGTVDRQRIYDIQQTYSNEFIGVGEIIYSESTYLQHYFITKFSSEFEIIWSKLFFFSDWKYWISQFSSIIPLKEGGFILNGTVTKSVGPTYQYNPHIYIFRMNESGEITWSTRFMSFDITREVNSVANTLYQNSENNLVLVTSNGVTYSVDDLGSHISLVFVIDIETGKILMKKKVIHEIISCFPILTKKCDGFSGALQTKRGFLVYGLGTYTSRRRGSANYSYIEYNFISEYRIMENYKIERISGFSFENSKWFHEGDCEYDLVDILETSTSNLIVSADFYCPSLYDYPSALMLGINLHFSTPKIQWARMFSFIQHSAWYTLVKQSIETESGDILSLVEHKTGLESHSSLLKLDSETGDVIWSRIVTLPIPGIIDSIVKNKDGTIMLWSKINLTSSSSSSRQLYNNYGNFIVRLDSNGEICSEGVLEKDFPLHLAENLTRDFSISMLKSDRENSILEVRTTHKLPKFEILSSSTSLSRIDSPFCGGHGVCVSVSDRARCKCFEYYYSSECHIWECFGVNNTNKDVCFSHGKCKSHNQCDCFEGYSSWDCQEWQCFGIDRFDADVCKSRGVCSSRNKCACFNHYLGDQCQKTTCNNITSDETGKVCSGNGTCVDYNKCSCFRGYSGKYCDDHVSFICSGKSSDDPNVCGGNGECIENDICLCHFPYSGKKNCENKSYIFLMVFSSIFVCCCISCLVFSMIMGVSYSLNRLNREKNKFTIPIFDDEDRETEVVKIRYNPEANLDELKGPYAILRRDEKTGTTHLSYSGHMKDGRKHGIGIEYYENEVKKREIETTNDDDDVRVFEFEYDEDELQVKFEGNFKDGKREGRGDLYLRKDHSKSINQNKIISAKWTNDHITEIIEEHVNLIPVDLSRIRKLRHISNGAHGSVFEIEFEGKKAAMKILNAAVFDTTHLESVKSLVRSLGIWTTVSDHKNVLEVKAWSGRKSYYHLGYITELCETSLAEYMKDKKPGISRKVDILFEVATTMAFLHSKSIMHRDLKPGNILLDDTDTTPIVKICDFGDCRYDDDDWRISSCEKTSFIGTSVYMAPEVNIFKRRYTKKCDIYSFGILVFSIYFSNSNPYRWTDVCDKCGCVVNNNDIPSLMEHVGHGLRPKIESKLLSEEEWMIKDLFIRCVDAKPESRPSFDEIVKIFKEKYYDIIGDHPKVRKLLNINYED